MANIISIGTAVPEFCHKQNDILKFMQQAYKLEQGDARKLAFLYKHSEIDKRYSVIDDFGKNEPDWQFVTGTDEGPSLEYRLKIFDDQAVKLSIAAINDCITGLIVPADITHLISVSCTGMSAPGLDLQVAEALQLNQAIFRTSVNFMGCYAAIHALKLAKMICDSTAGANVVIVCTEICTIHFQQKYNLDNAASSLLFGDGSAAVLVSNTISSPEAVTINNFYSEVSIKGKDEMSWQLSSHGFLMKLSSYIPQLIEEDIEGLVNRALEKGGMQQNNITHWCIHPGGKKILDVIESQLSLDPEALSCSRSVLSEFGNMSSPTILFVLKKIMERLDKAANIFGVAFGPGLTMETFIATKA